MSEILNPNQYEPHNSLRYFLCYNQNRSDFEDVAFQIINSLKLNEIKNSIENNISLHFKLEEINKVSARKMFDWFLYSEPEKNDEICIRCYNSYGEIVESINLFGLTIKKFQTQKFNYPTSMIYNIECKADFFYVKEWFDSNTKIIKHDNSNNNLGARKPMRAWAIKHNSHGLCYDTLVFLPEGEKPETNEEWVRCSWLDERYE